MIQRYELHYDDENEWTVTKDNDGEYVLYADYLVEIAEKDKEIKDKDVLLYLEKRLRD